MADVDFSEVYRMQAGFLSEAQHIEVELKALAHRRARAVHAGARQRVPVATGKTKAALTVVDDSGRKQFRVEVADIPGRDPMVPVYIEFGTVGTVGTFGTAARPFLRPSLDENRDGYIAEANELVTHLERAGR